MADADGCGYIPAEDPRRGNGTPSFHKSSLFEKIGRQRGIGSKGNVFERIAEPLPAGLRPAGGRAIISTKWVEDS
jgi:hypothetical protein